MMDFKFDPAYLQLLDSNQGLRKELESEIAINQANEKKIHILIKEVESCHRTISFQDNTIIAHETEVQELKSQVSNLEKRLRIALKGVNEKEAFILHQDIQISDLESEVEHLKLQIHRIFSCKYIPKDNPDMAQQIRAPVLNEAQTITESVRNTFRNINRIFRRNTSSNTPGADIEREFDDIKNAVKRLQEISDWEKNRADQAQAQVNQVEGDYRIMLLAYNNEKNERRHWFYSYKDKHRRVSELLCKKFATQLLLHSYKQQLQESQNRCRGLQQELDTCQDDLLLSDIQLDNKWGKWKLRARNSEQTINNLNQNILNLQNININHPHNISSMVLGYGPKTFDGTGDPEEFINELRRFTVASRINIAPGDANAPGRAELDGLLESCLVGDIKIWYENNVKHRNWMLDNVLDGTGVASISALRAINNATLTGINANQFLNEALNVHGQAGATGASIIPVGTWDEDWSIAGGHPAPAGTAVVAPNANTGNPIVAPGITVGQKIYLLKNESPPIIVQKNMAIFGQIMQGNKSVPQFSADIRKYGKLARMTPAQQHDQWRRGLNPFNQYNIRQGGLFFKTWDEQIRDLTELETYTLNIQSGQNIYQPQNPYSYQAPVQQPSYQAPVQTPVQSQVIQTPKTNTRPRRPKAVGSITFSVDANGNPIAPVKERKVPPKLPPKDDKEIEAYYQLKLIHDMGYSDFDEFFKARQNYIPATAIRKNPDIKVNTPPIKPPLPRKPRGKTKAQLENELEEARKKLEEFHISTPQSVPSVHNAYLDPPNSEVEEYEDEEYEDNVNEVDDEENEDIYVHNAEIVADPYDGEKKNL